MISENIKDRIKGVLMGIAAGDRIGGIINLSVRLSESLISCKKFDIDHIGKTYLDWYNNGAFDTGQVATMVFSYVNKGLSFNEAVNKVDEELGGLTAGCNPVHRNSPLAMVSFIKDEQLVDFAKQETLLTHKNCLAGDVAATNVVLCRALINGDNWEVALQKAANGRMLPTTQALLYSSEKTISRQGYSPEVLEAAIYFLNTSNSFKEALESSIEFAGAANYCPVLVGAIGGARWGASSIPEEIYFRCKILPRVKEVAKTIAEQWI